MLDYPENDLLGPDDFNSSDLCSDPQARAAADALAMDLASDRYWDILTSLFWVICRDVRQVAWLRTAALLSTEASEYINHPDAMADFDAGYADCEGITIVEGRPSFHLHRALKNGELSAQGVFPNELTPREISAAMWSASKIGGGLTGKSLVGSCVYNSISILGVTVERQALVETFPAVEAKRRSEGTHLTDLQIEIEIRRAEELNRKKMTDKACGELARLFPGTKRDAFRAVRKRLYPDAKPGRPPKNNDLKCAR
ncbi:hypothetical protein [Asticcacaulis sp.]|uniref:hypothetical protein n=1 Tax=Asticcacaulis sp. TaxID=1872648 RepID=UPI0031D07D91